MISRSGTCHVITQENILTLKGPENMKGWAWNSNILPQVLPNKTAMLNKNLLPFSIRYILCSRAGFFFMRDSLWAKAASTATLLENNLITPNRD